MKYQITDLIMQPSNLITFFKKLFSTLRDFLHTNLVKKNSVLFLLLFGLSFNLHMEPYLGVMCLFHL